MPPGKPWSNLLPPRHSHPDTPLSPRQNSDEYISVPSSYGAIHSSPAPGVVVGIVLGSALFFVLILVLVYTILNFGRRVDDSSVSYTTGSVLTLRSRRHRASTRSRSRSRRRRVVETVEVRTRESRSERGAGGGRPIIVDAEPSVRHVSGDRRSRRAPRIVEESDSGSESEFDVITVEEDASTPPRRHRDDDRRRGSSYRDVSVERRGSRR